MLRELKTENFDKVFEIMDESFPINEYRPYEEQKALLDNPLYKIYTFSDRGEVQAFLCIWEFDLVTYVEHFAVNPAHRNKGIGSKMLRELIQRSEKMICLEVEPPADKRKARRIDFYRRNGFFLNDYPYIQPPISKGRSSVPLYIMTMGRKINEKEYWDIKRVLYTEVYRIPSLEK